MDQIPRNLPLPLTPCIGRSWEIAEVARLLTRARLLTLTGVGGGGKTRLALEVARTLLDSYQDGVFFVDLAPVVDSQAVLSTVAHAVGLRDTPFRSTLQLLVEQLAGRRVLLVLDNFEHVLTAAPGIVQLLEATSPLQILVTSRAMLRVSGEYCFPVAPLGLPDLRNASSLEAIRSSAAAALFIERASAVQPNFALTVENAATIAAICARLDGLPLAIELAAARCRHLPLPALLARLENRFALLIGGPQDRPSRQQSLRGAISWSYDLLAPSEQQLFRRLAVFIGGCTLEGIEAISSDESKGSDGEVDVVASLLDKSLLQRVDLPNGETRFSMLETIHEFAAEQLTRDEDADDVPRRHAMLYVRFAEDAEAQLEGAKQSRWLDRLELEHANIQAALRWLIDNGEVELAQRLAGALWMFWFMRGYLAEGRGWLSSVLALAGSPGSSAARAKALNAAGVLARWQGDNQAARTYIDESLAYYRATGDQAGVSAALDNLGWVVLVQGDYEYARALYEEHLVLNQALDNSQGIAEARSQLAVIARLRGDYDQARSLFAESQGVWERLGDVQGVSWVALQLGEIALCLGDPTRARAHFEEHRRLVQQIGHRQALADSLCVFGKIALAEGDYERGFTLIDESQSLYRALGDPPDVVNGMLWHARVAHLQGATDVALVRYADLLTVRRAMGDRLGLASGLEGLATVELARGRPEVTACLLGAAEGLRAELGAPIAPSDRSDHDRMIAAARQALGPAEFAAAWDRGRVERHHIASGGWSFGNAAPIPAMASGPTGLTTAKPSTPLPDGLTAREVDVLTRLAGGQSTKEIADELVLSPRTVERHIANIYGKIGVNGRAAAATYAARHRLIPT